MIVVTVQLYGPYREAIGTNSLSQKVSADATVELLLSELLSRFPSSSERKMSSPTDLVEQTYITVNKRNIEHLDGMDTVLNDEDVVRLSPPVAGG
ncbi:MoaD family protein [Haloferax profundi]|uniref:MoaD family protein n=1 Tax=Haloferax profundi TaxID=1544718 RepID=UPI0009EAB95F